MAETWTVDQYRKHVTKPHQPKRNPSGNKYKAEMELMLKLLGYNYEKERLFHSSRKWRFDFCLPDYKIAIEYNGIMSDKSRHTTVKGYTGDMEKLNEAQKLGWTVLQYTPLNYKSLGKDIKEIIKNLKDNHEPEN
jgi:very-short-patch-repair endonuclease